MATHTEKQPQPVLTRAGIVTALAVLSALCVKLGAADVSAWLDAHSDPIAALLLAVAPTVSAVLARRHVTPSVRPKAPDGTPLVPAGTLTATNAAVDVALAKVAAIAAAPDFSSTTDAAGLEWTTDVDNPPHRVAPMTPPGV